MNATLSLSKAFRELCPSKKNSIYNKLIQNFLSYRNNLIKNKFSTEFPK